MSVNRSQSVRSLSFLFVIFPPLFMAAALAQSDPSAQSGATSPVSYSSASQLNQLLAQIEQISQATQLDLVKMRIEKWKTDSNSKRQTQGNVESIQRNLQTALPDLIGQLRNSPENLAVSFKLYRNLDALYDVFGSVVESAGAFGNKDEFQSLSNDFDGVERARRSFADRVETLASTKEGELGQLRIQIHNMQVAVDAAPPKKVVVDDTEPAKKTPPKKKTVTKKPSTPPPTGTPTDDAAPGKNTNPSATTKP
jgi:hypothetical protein